MQELKLPKVDITRVDMRLSSTVAHWNVFSTSRLSEYILAERDFRVRAHVPDEPRPHARRVSRPRMRMRGRTDRRIGGAGGGSVGGSYRRISTRLLLVPLIALGVTWVVGLLLRVTVLARIGQIGLRYAAAVLVVVAGLAMVYGVLVTAKQGSRARVTWLWTRARGLVTVNRGAGMLPAAAVRKAIAEGLAIGATIRLITEEALSGDSQLRGWLATRAEGYRYSLLRIVCSFRGAHGHALVELSIRARLRALEPSDPNPVVHAMMPKTSNVATEVTETVKLGTGLKLFEASQERKTTKTAEAAAIRAYGELQSAAEWSLFRGARFDEEKQYVLIIEQPAHAPAACEIKVSARFRLPGGDEAYFHASLPDHLRQIPLP